MNRDKARPNARCAPFHTKIDEVREDAIDMKQGAAHANNTDHLPWLDGLRGFAALWVLVSHAQILSGMRGIPVLSWGELAVDLFMLLSGFLMAHHYVLRQEKEPWDAKSTFFTFWLRRFFRIAPLYYFLLFFALVLGPWIGDWRDAIALQWPATATSPARYDDQSLGNILMHVSFLFGAFPDYAFRTPLPDWSIGLEMSFYLAFPFLMLLVLRMGLLTAGLLTITLAGISLVIFKGYFEQFAMPSFLPLKLYLFFIGIWLAVSRLQGGMKVALAMSVMVLIAVGLIERSDQALGRMVVVIGMFYLMNDGSLPGSGLLQGSIEKLRAVLSSRVSRFLGDTSYGVYLLHLLILIPVAGMLTHSTTYLALSGPLRLLVCAALVAPPVYLTAWLLFRTVETGGIRMGKRVILQTIDRTRHACRPAET
jgi:peptidoglycan/LPS O-acetylase OafA/YrhL